MATAQIHASHLVQDSPTSPSPSSLIASADNQFALITKSTIFLYTPATTIQLDLNSLKQAEAKASLAKGKGKSLKHQNELSMFATSLLVEKKDLINWHTFADGQSRHPLTESSHSDSYSYCLLRFKLRLSSRRCWST